MARIPDFIDYVPWGSARGVVDQVFNAGDRMSIPPQVTALLVSLVFVGTLLLAIRVVVPSWYGELRRMWRGSMLVTALGGLLLVAAGACLFYAYRTAPRTIPIAFEARQISMSAKHPFIEVASGDKEEGNAQIFDYGSVSITNISRDSAVSLDIYLRIKGSAPGDKFNILRRADAIGPFGKIYGVDDLGSLMANKAGLQIQEVFRSPVRIGPQDSVEKRLVFIVSGVPVRDAILERLARGLEYSLKITDSVSGVTVEVPLPAAYRGG